MTIFSVYESVDFFFFLRPFKGNGVSFKLIISFHKKAPPVNWSAELEESAAKWSRHLADNNLFKHERGKSDNLYMSHKPPKMPCTSATDAFYSEVKLYDYNNPLKKWARTGHFTQVTWLKCKVQTSEDHQV